MCVTMSGRRRRQPCGYRVVLIRETLICLHGNCKGSQYLNVTDATRVYHYRNTNCEEIESELILTSLSEHNKLVMTNISHEHTECSVSHINIFPAG